MSNCPHHKYIADDIEKLEERVIELEKVTSTTTTMLTNLCSEIGRLAESIKDLAASFTELQEATITSTIMAKENEDDIKEILNIPDNKDVVIGAALGYADPASPINEFTSPREELESFVRWID